MTHPVTIQRDFPLKKLNTFGISAMTQAYVSVESVDDLKSIYADPLLQKMKKLVLGGGSNMLFTRNFPGLVVHLCQKGKTLYREDESAVYVSAAAGENWHEFVCWTLENGWGGLENLSLIPGTVGAAPVQNIGAYGAELKDCFHSLSAFDFETGDIQTFSKADCRFAYRDSFFKQEASGRYAIVKVNFCLPKQWEPNLSYSELAQALSARGISSPSPEEISQVIIHIRQHKLPDPAFIGNAGSFFKNPLVSKAEFEALRITHPQIPGYLQGDGRYRIAAGWLIDQCGWRGKTSGNAGVFETQALVLVNRGGATGLEIVRLAANIQHDVKNRFGLKLEPEPVFI